MTCERAGLKESQRKIARYIQTSKQIKGNKKCTGIAHKIKLFNQHEHIEHYTDVHKKYSIHSSDSIMVSGQAGSCQGEVTPATASMSFSH